MAKTSHDSAKLIGKLNKGKLIAKAVMPLKLMIIAIRVQNDVGTVYNILVTLCMFVFIYVYF